eukprot:CAMPEP_0197657614 /NCGR_PEP_ID=MMETSP1338-20131121/44738_1 /TAXON_ID=43686 ORGANISM="Pelagodinium beii, Strain RCC1491" /NCGR_SAMPLE_ID=MMETSP1338 /ASSEMBLY_ACC=CAM_ASM_000754 /LENGTH=399 /DNA_ID=CAMNT_0043234027 /DNA_START=69 /DNA_END=1268 /DNA_ORIENTATION=-
MRRSQQSWTDKNSSRGLCLLALDDRQGNSSRRGASLPQYLYSDVIAPFLQFHGPQPGQLYALGGRNEEQEPLDTVEMFDTWHGRWMTCPSMLRHRAGSSAATLPDGRLMVVGGYDNGGIVTGLLDSCEVFDPVKQTWTECEAKLQRPRWGHGCAFLGDCVYCAGGCSLRDGSPAHEAFMETLRSCEVFDPVAGIWSMCPDLNIGRAGARVVALGEHHLAVVGGCDDVFGRAELLQSVELLDIRRPSAGWVLLTTQLSTPRTTAAVAALDDHQILIIGGAPSLASAELYSVRDKNASLDAGSPTAHVSSMTEGRMGCQAACLNLPSPGKDFPICDRRCVVVVGGESGDDELESQIRQFSSVLVYDVEDGKWLPSHYFPPIPTPRTAMALCVAPGCIHGHL